MTPQARAQAAIEILDQVIASAKDHGPPADSIVSAYFKIRRYAGSKDRRAVRDLVFQAIRAVALPASGRSALLAIEGVEEWFDGSPHAPAPHSDADEVAIRSFVPDWLTAEMSPLVSPDEWPALAERAPLDLRVNIARTTRAAMLDAFPGSIPTPLSPWGIRMPADSRVDQHPAFNTGLVEVQDEGSQLIALTCKPIDGARILDLCAGAGGKALALAAAAPGAKILATDSNRSRLAKLPQRAGRAAADIETRLLSPPNEAAELADWHGAANLVLVDAPCSGSGTWRRSPDGRWRLSPEQFDRVIALQAHLLDMAAPLVRPGGSLVYAVCSLLSREGAGQISDFLSRHSSWMAEWPQINGGRADGAGLLLTPGHDGCDGFFVARVKRPC